MVDMEMDETNISRAKSNEPKGEKFPLLPIASKYPYTSPPSESRIFSSFSTYFSKSWIPHSLLSSISNIPSIISYALTTIISHIPPTPLFYLSTSFSYISTILSSLIKRRKNRKLFFIFSQLFLTFTIYRYYIAGPFLPFSCQVIGLGCPNIKINGFASPEFGKVQKIFEDNFKNGLDVGAGVSVYYDNKLVVDLQGGIADSSGKNYDEDTLQLIFSSSKVLSGIVVARLVEQGLLDYSSKISKYWPEFAQGNKENVTLQNLMTHTAGVGFINPHQMSQKDLSDLDSLSEILASQSHNFNGIPKKSYHAVTRGWYLNEIVRRVDPRHRTIGRIVAEEISPEYNIEFYHSINSKSLYSRVANIYTYPLVRILAKVLLPKWMISEPLHAVFDGMMEQGSIGYKTFIETSPDRSEPQDWNKLDMVRYEGPSYNGITNSKSIAKLAAMMANQGKSLDDSKSKNYTFLEPTLISAKTYSLITTRLPTEYDAALHENMTSTIGGFGCFRLEGIEDVEFMGWGGSGGSLFLWNEELKIGFGYVMNAFHTSLLGDKRSLKMLREVVDVVKKLRK
ncbi:hypothetical protein Glove_208g42 [Diversispora epigaea]|uniref:Beta-lactamase-related domain-containing protein n=1 Tax=Diversispora epigaea TaxID=1348612 RepID=A0A397IJE8_9GLOM|nr:hypothetical protein Glove_208g42 [Diversispora epigaea]